MLGRTLDIVFMTLKKKKNPMLGVLHDTVKK
jgi:hypothetical protein